MREKIIKPRWILYTLLCMFFFITALMIFLFLTNIELGIVFVILWLLLVCLFLKLGMESYHKDWIEIINEKLIIDQKVMELVDNYRIPSKGVWIHQRLKMDP